MLESDSLPGSVCLADSPGRGPAETRNFRSASIGPEGMLSGPNPLLEFVCHGGSPPGQDFGPGGIAVINDEIHIPEKRLRPFARLTCRSRFAVKAARQF